MQVSVGNENSNCNCCRFPVSVSQQCPIPIIKGNTVTGCMNRISTWEVYKFVFLLNFRLKVLALLFFGSFWLSHSSKNLEQREKLQSVI